jgi:outer membrane immunogenic protein
MLSIALSAASTVEAADLAPRPVPPAVAYNWSGFYVGGTVGWGWGNFNPHSSTVVDGYISSHTDVAGIGGNPPEDNFRASGAFGTRKIGV